MKNSMPLIRDAERAIRELPDGQTMPAVQMRLQIPILLALFYLASCAPKQIHVADEDSLSILKSQMSDSLYQATEGRHVQRRHRVINTEGHAIELARPVFIAMYGKAYGVEERQYTSHLVNGFWVVKGLLPRGYTGGTLVAVFDSETGELSYTLVWN